jgi:hypothetical protein
MVGKSITLKDYENRIEEYRDYKVFKNHCDYIMKAYDNLDVCRYSGVVFLDERFRGFGKSSFIKNLSLIAMSDGYKVIVIGCNGIEYYCDEFTSIHSNLSDIKPRPLRNAIILVDEITDKQLASILEIYPTNRIFGFGRDV